MKLYRWFQLTMPVVACRGLESQRYKWAKIRIFGVRQPPEVDRGVVNWLWFSPRLSNRSVILCRASQEAVLCRSGGSFG